MRASHEKLARLERELQDTYDAWMAASAWQASKGRLDNSGTSEGARAQWFDHLAAKERLVSACSARPCDVAAVW